MWSLEDVIYSGLQVITHFQTEFPACVIASFRNALDRMESTADVPCLKTDIFGCDFLNLRL